MRISNYVQALLILLKIGILIIQFAYTYNKTVLYSRTLYDYVAIVHMSTIESDNAPQFASRSIKCFRGPINYYSEEILEVVPPKRLTILYSDCAIVSYLS